MRRKRIKSAILAGILFCMSCLNTYSAEQILVPSDWGSFEAAMETENREGMAEEEKSNLEGTPSMEEMPVLEENLWEENFSEKEALEETKEWEDSDSAFTDKEKDTEEEEPGLFFDLPGTDSSDAKGEADFLDIEAIEELSPESEMGEEFLEAVKDGDVFLLTPFLEVASWEEAEDWGDTTVALASSPSGYTLVQKGALVLDDSTGDWANTGYRFLQYTDSEGIERETPLYCMNASRTANGVQGQMVPSNGYTGSAPLQKVEPLQNITLQKILYYGFKGPQDKTLEMPDPTCSHIDWSNGLNRYAFTHYALSYVYSGDLGGVSVAHAEESGLMRFIDYMKSQTLPVFNDLKFNVRNSSSESSTTTYSIGKDITSTFSLNRNPSAAVAAMTGFTDGYQISNAINITGSKLNYINIKTPEAGNWRILYWKNQTEYKAGIAAATISEPGETVRLYGGYYFRVVCSPNRKTTWKLTWNMGLRPTEFVLVRGNLNINYPQYAYEEQQDFGAFVYTEPAATMSLTFTPQPYGYLSVTKNSSYTGKTVSGAKFALYAGETIYTATNLAYKKDQKVEEFTMTEGTYKISMLHPGKYYFKELAAPASYLADTSTQYPVTLKASDCVKEDGSYKTVNTVIVNDPNIKVKIHIQKVDADSGENLTGAVFVLDEWNGSKYEAKSSYKVTYNAEKKWYESSTLTWTTQNQGKFRIRETQPPKGYTGNFSKTFVIGQGFPSYEKELSLGQAKNSKNEEKHIRISKKDSVTGAILSGAEFTLSEWSQSGFVEKEILKWVEEPAVYESSALEITEANQGRFLVKETKAPEGYTGNYEEEFDLNKEEDTLYRDVTNEQIVLPSGFVRIIKKDSKTNGILSGAKFEILEWNREKERFETPETGPVKISYQKENGYYESERVYKSEKNEGKYLIRETENPEGYTGNFEEAFEIKAYQKNEFLFTVYNDPPTEFAEIIVTKRIKEGDINWANGNPTFFFVVEGTDINGTFHHYEDYVLYVPGGNVYTVDSAGYALQSVVFSNIPAGSYQVYEREAARYRLDSLTSSSPNVRIISNGSGLVGGLYTKHGQAELGTDAGNGMLTCELVFTNERTRWDRFSHTDVVKNTIGNVLREE